MAYQRTLAFPDKYGPPPYGSSSTKPSVMVTSVPETSNAPLCLQHSNPLDEEDAKSDLVEKSAPPEHLDVPIWGPTKLTDAQWVGKWNQSSYPSLNTFACSIIYDVERLEKHHRGTNPVECAVIDSGATDTVVGGKWIESFPHASRKPAIMVRSRRFEFGESRSFDIIGVISIPVNLPGISLSGKKHCKMRCDIRADIVTANIPLLVSMQSLKAMNSTINFTSDELTIGCKMIVSLRLAENGHLILPLARETHETEKGACPTFAQTEPTAMPVSYELAKKLHYQLAHLNIDGLIRILDTAGMKADLSLVEKAAADFTFINQRQHTERPIIKESIPLYCGHTLFVDTFYPVESTLLRRQAFPFLMITCGLSRF